MTKQLSKLTLLKRELVDLKDTLHYRTEELSKSEEEAERLKDEKEREKRNEMCGLKTEVHEKETEIQHLMDIIMAQINPKFPIWKLKKQIEADKRRRY